MTRRAGVTLVELVVTIAVFSIIGLVLVVLYGTSYTTYNQGSSRMALQQRGREAVRRIAPIIMAAFDDDGVPGDAAIEWPPPDGNLYANLVVRTSEDWLAPGYPTGTSSARLAPTVADIGFFVYRVQLQSSNVLLEKGTWEEGTSTFTPTGESRVIGRSDSSGDQPVTVQSLQFRQLAPNAVLVRIRVQGSVRNAQNQERTMVHTLESVVNVPHSSLRNPL